MNKICFKNLLLLIICLFKLNYINSSTEPKEKDNIANNMALVKRDGLPMALDIITGLNSNSQEIIFQYLTWYFCRSWNIKTDVLFLNFPDEENSKNSNLAIVILKNGIKKTLFLRSEEFEKWLKTSNSLPADFADVELHKLLEGSNKFGCEKLKRNVGTVVPYSVYEDPYSMCNYPYGMTNHQQFIYFLSKNCKYIAKLPCYDDDVNISIQVQNTITNNTYRLRNILLPTIKFENPAISFSIDERYMSVYRKSKIYLFDLELQQLVKSITVNTKVLATIISRDNKYIYAILDNGFVIIYNIETDKRITFKVSNNRIWPFFALSRDQSKFLVTVSPQDFNYLKEVQLWIDQAQELRNSPPL